MNTQFINETTATITKQANIKKYKKDMKRLTVKIHRNYLDCFWFQRLNKEFYMLMIVTQVMSSMAFNGLFDIPALIMILALFSFYAFRKSIPRAYGLYVMGIVFYIHLAAFCNVSI